MSKLDSLFKELLKHPQTWLVTGVAGFIGSNLLEFLLKCNQTVVGLDNFSTGHKKNLDDIKQAVSPNHWKNFSFHEGDIQDFETCQKVVSGVDCILHQAALGSVPRSIEHPLQTNDVNVTGTLNVLVAAQKAGIKRVVYASSSSVYGDYPKLPKVETKMGLILSPYAASKLTNEIYAQAFSVNHGMELIGLRYFNVFGKRQDPEGVYAAVIPKWVSQMIRNQTITVFGNGETSRDFCYIDNVLQANLLAATIQNPAAFNNAYNIAYGDRTTLNGLFEILRSKLLKHNPHLQNLKPFYRDFRPGDIMHSLADISKAKDLLGYEPTHDVVDGIDQTLKWYIENV